MEVSPLYGDSLHIQEPTGPDVCLFRSHQHVLTYLTPVSFIADLYTTTPSAQF